MNAAQSAPTTAIASPDNSLRTSSNIPAPLMWLTDMVPNRTQPRLYFHLLRAMSRLPTPQSPFSIEEELVLPRHRIGWISTILRGVLQQGHRAKVRARATIRYRRIVAIEFATCRSGRTGGASRSAPRGGGFWETPDAANLSAAVPATEGKS